MDLLSAMDISASGLAAQRVRMNVVSSNLANANTTRTAEGGPYKKRSVVIEAHNVKNSFQQALDDQLQKQVKGVRVVGIQESQQPPVEIYDPSHPDADEKGYVKLPNINRMAEMVDMISASRSFEANVTAVNASKGMAMKALEIAK